MRGLCALCLWLCHSLALGQIYATQDEQGRTVFTDRPPHAGAAALPLKPVNQLPPPQTVEMIPRDTVQAIEVSVDYELSIVSPTPDQTVQDGSGTLTIQVNLNPALESNHSLQALINGQAYGSSSGQSRFSIANLDRGSHSLAVQVQDAKGQVLAVSATQTIHLRRITLSDRRRVNPCQLKDYGKRLECPLKDKPKEKKDLPFIPFI